MRAFSQDKIITHRYEILAIEKDQKDNSCKQ